MKLLFISIALILQLWHAQGKQSLASFLSSRITWACFRVLFFLLLATQPKRSPLCFLSCAWCVGHSVWIELSSVSLSGLSNTQKPAGTK